MDGTDERLPGGGFTTRSSGTRRPPHAGCEPCPSRRCFLKWSVAAGTWVFSAPILRDFGWPDGALDASSGQAAAPGLRIVRTGCPSHNCGGRCLLKVHVRDGIIVRIETDDRPADTFEAPQLRACVRGRAYRRRQYHPDRLLHPLKRVGRRGEGRFAADHVGRGARSHGGRVDPREDEVRQLRALRPVRHRQLQPDQRPPDGPAPAEPLRRLARALQQLLVGVRWRPRPRPSTARTSPATSARTG